MRYDFGVRLALAQTNPIIGDIDRNVAAIIAAIARAADEGAALVVLPEHAILGYPAKDLLLRRDVITRNVDGLRRVAAAARGAAAVVGFAEPSGRPFGRSLYNAAALVHRGEVLGVSRKRLLPTYDVFDEARYFEAAASQPLISFGGLKLGVTICEDMWSRDEMHGQPLYDCDPIADCARAGADVILNVSASPFSLGKHERRAALLADHARRHRVPLALVNQVGGNDELLFDGASIVVDREGAVVARARSFVEDLLLVDLDDLAASRVEPRAGGMHELEAALVLGVRDYARKCGFREAVVGLSGGVDSAVVACLAADALGAERVHGLAMPSRYSSDHSVADARALAANLGIRFSIVPIEPLHAAVQRVVGPLLGDAAGGVVDENLQARVRGAILMATSNAHGGLLLTTGNKSELAVGYCTLYGDMCGGLAVISDVPKTMVYQLARHINSRGPRAPIPQRTIEKPPSAELRPDQTDQDSLPPYDVLDDILDRYEVRLESAEQIVAAGHDAAVVADVLRKVRRSEYKRQQAAQGLKVTSRAFGFGRRMPIAAASPDGL